MTTQNVARLKNSKCDKNPKIKSDKIQMVHNLTQIARYLKTQIVRDTKCQIVTKPKNSNWDYTQKLKL